MTNLPATTEQSALSMKRSVGGAVTTDLGYNIMVNKGSTLKREWFVIRDEAAPVEIDGATGVSVVFKSERSDFHYELGYDLKAKEPITAVEVRVHVLNVFGALLKTLSTTEVTDFSGRKGFSSNWRVWSENEAMEAFASVVYVAQVRTASGRVYEIDKAALLDQVCQVTKRISESDLEPKKEASGR